MYQFVLSLMLLLNRLRPVADLEPIASAIAQVARTPPEARVLVTLHFNESGFNPRHRIPFGVMNVRGAPDMVEAARRALRIWEFGRRACRSVGRAFVFYNRGRCDAASVDAVRAYTSTLARIGGPAALAAR